MLKNALSLNRIANIFYIILKELKIYDESKHSLSKEEKIQKLQKIIKNIDIAIGVIDRKINLRGISREFVEEAKKIKAQQAKGDRNWYDYLNVFEWFK